LQGVAELKEAEIKYLHANDSKASGISKNGSKASKIKVHEK